MATPESFEVESPETWINRTMRSLLMDPLDSDSYSSADVSVPCNSVDSSNDSGYSSIILETPSFLDTPDTTVASRSPAAPLLHHHVEYSLPSLELKPWGLPNYNFSASTDAPSIPDDLAFTGCWFESRPPQVGGQSSNLSHITHKSQIDCEPGFPDSHEPQFPIVAGPMTAGTTETPADLHHQAVESLMPSRDHGQYGVYTPTFRALGVGGGLPHESAESTWENKAQRPSDQTSSISTSPWGSDDTTRNESHAMERQTSRGTGITDDTVQLPWTSDDRFAMKSSHSFLSVERFAVQEVVHGFQTWKLGGGTADASGSPSISSSSQTQKQDKGRNPRKRPSRSGEDGDESADNGGDGPPLKKQRRKKVSEGQPRLACHFQKRFPDRHPTCGSWCLISHVKQHLRLKHTRSPYYCPRCNRIFKTEEERDEHLELMASSPCPKQFYNTSSEISASVAKKLQKRVEKAAELYEQWFSVWDTIFPGVPRPVTCTYDICSDLPVQVLGLYSYLESEGPGTVVSFLQRHGLVIAPETPRPMSPDLETYIRRVLFEACREICQKWRSQKEQASFAKSSPSNVVNTGPNTPRDTNTARNIMGGIPIGVGPSLQYGTNAEPCVPLSSANNEINNAVGLPMPSNSGQLSSMPISTFDFNNLEDDILHTARDGFLSVEDNVTQDGSNSILRYPYEDEHLVEAVNNFEMPPLRNFTLEDQRVTFEDQRVTFEDQRVT